MSTNFVKKTQQIGLLSLEICEINSIFDENVVGILKISAILDLSAWQHCGICSSGSILQYETRFFSCLRPD